MAAVMLAASVAPATGQSTIRVLSASEDSSAVLAAPAKQPTPAQQQFLKPSDALASCENSAPNVAKGSAMPELRVINQLDKPSPASAVLVTEPVRTAFTVMAPASAALPSTSSQGRVMPSFLAQWTLAVFRPCKSRRRLP